MTPHVKYDLLFADFDGVMHGFVGGVTFTKKDVFEQFLREHPHVLVVFSTSWRFSQTFEKLKSWFSPDLYDRFIGVNPTVQVKWPPYIKHERYKECLKFMEERGGWPGRWYAIDDADDLFPPNCENLILCDGNIGIDDNILSILRNKFSVATQYNH